MRARSKSPARTHRQYEIVKLLAAEPGTTRAGLAERFSLSERQIQADLRVIARDRYVVTANVKLVRGKGYRLVPVDMQVI